MPTTYNLLNPHIIGDFKNEVTATDSAAAAKIFYNNLSQHFNNAVPKFHFTIQKGKTGNGKYYHYEVTEKRTNDKVTFKIKHMADIPSTPDAMSPFIEKLDKFKSKIDQDGGKKKHRKSKKSKKYDDSSDSDSDSDDFYKSIRSYRPVNQPIYYWWYDPYIYKLDSLYIPTFYSYITPYIELGLYPYIYP